MDDMGRTVFSVTAEGSETLDIRWFINNQLVNNSNIQSQNAGPNQRQSRLFLQQTPRVNSTITAVVSDMDEFTKEQFSARMLVLVISQAQIGQSQLNL